MTDEIATIAMPGYVADYIGDWLADYQAVTQRIPAGTTEGHELRLMDTGRLLGQAGAVMRLLHDSTRRPAPAADAYLPAPPPFPERQPSFDAFAGPQALQP